MCSFRVFKTPSQLNVWLKNTNPYLAHPAVMKELAVCGYFSCVYTKFIRATAANLILQWVSTGVARIQLLCSWCWLAGWWSKPSLSRHGFVVVSPYALLEKWTSPRRHVYYEKRLCHHSHRWWKSGMLFGAIEFLRTIRHEFGSIFIHPITYVCYASTVSI